MLQLWPLSPDFALLVGRAAFLVFCFALAAVTFTRWRRASEAQTELFFEQNMKLLQRLTSLEAQLAASHTQLVSTRDEVATLAGRLAQEGEQRRTPAPAQGAVPSYQIAIRLARSGAPREELMTSCGLSRQEAELVQRLHAPARAKLAAAS
jgi:phage-related tail protein